MTLGMTVEDVARRASLASSTVARVLNGDGGAHLDTICAVGEAVGMKVGARAYPSVHPRLRDSGQLRMAHHLIGCAHTSFRAALELPVGDPFGRAADLVFFGTDEILHFELERRLADLQSQHRAAMVKREALHARHQRPVRLVLAIEDTRRNRGLVAAHLAVVQAALPETSRHVMHALRTGAPLGGDGFGVGTALGAPVGRTSVAPGREGYLAGPASRTPMDRRNVARAVWRVSPHRFIGVGDAPRSKMGRPRASPIPIHR